MASRKTKSVPTQVVPTPSAAITLTVPVPAPRNRLSMNPLLKKSSVHADVRKRQSRSDLLRSVQDRFGSLDSRAGNRRDYDQRICSRQ